MLQTAPPALPARSTLDPLPAFTRVPPSEERESRLHRVERRARETRPQKGRETLPHWAALRERRRQSAEGAASGQSAHPRVRATPTPRAHTRGEEHPPPLP